MKEFANNKEIGIDFGLTFYKCACNVHMTNPETPFVQLNHVSVFIIDCFTGDFPTACSEPLSSNWVKV